MINEKEIEAITFSATKKDFYQIWNELLETAGKLSERWNPASTNESDPGIVLLKVLTAIADKLNYTIDKNTLECFLPSASQEESMKKLCDMLGYTMKYYQSATTTATISYIGEKELTKTDIINIPKYTNLKNADDDVNYFTLSELNLDYLVSTSTVECMEGELCICGDDTNNIITINQLDDNNRYYLPETQIAENGIFITNIEDEKESNEWEIVSNLNTQLTGAKCFKLGFDSLLKQPYIQFPEDISSIIKDGLVIKYTRTNGINGNISYNTLSKLEEPASWSDLESDLLASGNFAVKNASAAVNGRDKETINDAYNAYKRTIGTFDTLITCRDYMNKIYQITMSETDTTPAVSNIIVSDIRDDINKAITLCTFEDYGIMYIDIPRKDSSSKDLISHFDLVLYPFTNISGSVTKTNYESSFKLSVANKSIIESGISENKTISHNLVYPEKTDIICIKNYLKLKAKITTTNKVNSVEESTILNNIYSAIYKNFNARKVDFGEEIPFDSILSVIQNADTRIKNVALEEPSLYTKYLLGDGTEKDVLDDTGKKCYNFLALRNILAGKIALFDYNTDFKANFSEANYSGYDKVYKKYGEGETEYHIGKVSAKFDIIQQETAEPVLLNENEVIQFRSPNFKTIKTYPAYVNYFLHLTANGNDAIPATFGTLRDFMAGQSAWSTYLWESFVNSNIKPTLEKKSLTADEAKTYWVQFGTLFTGSYPNYNAIKTQPTEAGEYSYFRFGTNTFGYLYNFIKSQNSAEGSGKKLLGLFKVISSDQSLEIGSMVDINKVKYIQSYQYSAFSSPLDNYFIQITFTTETSEHTKDGLGKNAEYKTISANSDYQLDDGEWLAINYTPSITADDGTSTQGTVVNYVYKNNEIIRPNFNLISSENYKQEQHTPTKTSGYDFTFESSVQTVIDYIGGMYTLNTNEQIEIREQVSIELSGSPINIYWERNDESELINAAGKIEFKFDEDEGMAYTLKEGEYFYYTDAAKIDLAYYGNGTKVIKGINTPILIKEKINSEALAEKVASEGLLAALPWNPLTLTADNSAITLQEFQYITLTTGDRLLTLGSDAGITELSSAWTKVTDNKASYKYADDDTTYKLANNSVKNANWFARTILNINCATNVIQTLHNSSTTKNEGKTSNTLVLHYYKKDGTFIDNKPLTPTSASKPLSVESNYICVSSSNEAIVHDLNSENSITDFSLKVFENKEVKGTSSSGESPINLNNYGTGKWTSVSFKDYKTITLNTNILDNTQGLIMFYYIDNTTTIEYKAYLTLSGTDTSINICNYSNGSKGKFADGWWAGHKKSTDQNQIKYYLQNGLNIVEIPTTCNSITVNRGTNTNSSIIWSDLDLVNYSNNNFVINPSIDYLITDSGIGSEIKQALKDIAEADKDYKFYYNNVLDSSNIIDINTDADEKLSSATTWYDYNNINNKFVISEINAEELSKGITLTSASRR